MRQANVYFQSSFAGRLSEEEDGYRFEYNDAYLGQPNAMDISLTLPTTQKVFRSKTMFPFFDGLIPEGWLLDISVRNWKLDPKDRMGLLMTCCRDCIGAVSVIASTKEDE
ncbi:MAG: HipA N-terminal domain-containing protein [Bacteroidales bacterium]|nr:HipA N-terminal domain-containing protein [Bacteroidales bacterium]